MPGNVFSQNVVAKYFVAFCERLTVKRARFTRFAKSSCCVLLHTTCWQSLKCVCSTKFQCLDECSQLLGNIANSFGNNYSAFESIANWLKYVVIHFHYIFFAFRLVFANRVTIILCRVMFLWYCRYCRYCVFIVFFV